MDCFICKTYLTLTSLSKHFKLIHGLHENDTYQCTYKNECFTYLMSFSSLSRHLKMHIQRTFSNAPSNANNLTTISGLNADLQLIPISHSTSISCVSSEDLIPADQSHSSLTLATVASNSPSDFADNGIFFALQLHNNLNFNRNDVLTIQNSVMNNIVGPMLNTVKNILKSNLTLDIEQEIMLTSLFKNIENPFQSCATEYKLIEQLKLNDNWKDFEEFIINNEIESVHSRGQIQYNAEETTGVLLPISFQFRKCFEKNDQLLHTIKEMEIISSNSEQFSHFIQGSLWRDKSNSFVNQNKILIPFCLYIDDAEINNPLGSHCDPVTFVYYSFPVIENSDIYLAALFKGKDYKTFGNEKCLFSLVREIINLENNGIIIKTSEGEKRRYILC